MNDVNSDTSQLTEATPDPRSSPSWGRATVLAAVAAGAALSMLVFLGRPSPANARRAAVDYVRQTTGRSPAGVACSSYWIGQPAQCVVRTFVGSRLHLLCDDDPEVLNDGCWE